MTLKERLEAVWKYEHCACPNHIARWNEKNIGYKIFDEFDLYYTKGLKLNGKKSRN